MKYRNAFAFSIAMLSTLAAHAVPPAVNFSDHWSSASEPGWGVGVSQQDTVMFVTFLLHEADGRSVWYSGTLTLFNDPGATAYVFDGDVHATTGPWFGGPASSGTVSHRKAGTAKFTAKSSNAATLAFTIDGVTVSKELTRLTLRNESIAGFYLGAVTRSSSCSGNVLIYEQRFLDIAVTQSGSAVEIRTDELGFPHTCTYAGTYVQNGQLGEVTGSYACNTKESGTFRITSLRAGVDGFFARMESKFTSVGVQPGSQCDGAGSFAGAFQSTP